MAQYTFFTNPMSRGQIARWALHEVGADYATELVDWMNKPAGLTVWSSYQFEGRGWFQRVLPVQIIKEEFDPQQQ